jgi:hypothetical protein
VRRALAALLAFSMTACAANPAPLGWLPRAEQAQSRACGGWITLQSAKGATPPRASGELIAVSEDRIYVLTDSGLLDLPQASVTKATLAAYASGAGVLGGWAALGTISTLSHGAILVLTAPLWIIAGSVAAASESKVALHRHPPTPLVQLRPWARFPQGLPAGFGDPGRGPLARGPCRPGDQR